MSTTRFAHLNTFQFMARKPSEQQQSPLFRLPRELRDLIYQYYVFEKNGYAYDPKSGKMMHRSCDSRTQNVVQHVLPLVCRKAAQELRGVAWSTNTIHFNAFYSVDDGAEYRGVRSRAGRFKCLLFYVQSQKIRMLIRANELLRPEDFVVIARQFPRVSHLFGAPLKEAVRDMHDHLCSSSISSGWCDIVGGTDFDEALHLLLENAKTRDPSKFASLVARLFGPGQSPVRPAITARACRNFFRNDALEIVNEWNPMPWDVPHDVDLASLEGFLTTPWRVDSDKELVISEDGFEPYELNPRCDWQSDIHRDSLNTKWYFSATTVAINILKHLPSKKLLYLRNLHFHEDYKAVSRPECHAIGLIPYCTENPLLRIERHISLLSNLLPSKFCELDNSPWCQPWSWLLGNDVLYALWDWIEEALRLPSLEMPRKCLRLVIEAADRESLEAWDIMKYAAMLQDAMALWATHCEVQAADPARDIDYIYARWPLPWHLPPNFSQAVRDIVQDTSTVQFRGADGVLWDAQLFFKAREEWKEDDWRQHWKDEVLGKGISTTFFINLRARYSIELDNAA